MATEITRTLGPGLTVTGTINENGIVIYRITLPSGKDFIVTDAELGSLVITEVATGLWLFTVGTLTIGSSDNPEDRGAILTLNAARGQIAAIGVELKNEAPVAEDDKEEDEEVVEYEEPETPDPEELTGVYNIPEEDEEDGPVLLTPPDPDEPEELNGYGYNVPNDDELVLLTKPDYGDEPPDVPDELTLTSQQPVDTTGEGAELLTPPGVGGGGGGGGGGSRGLFGNRAEARGSASIQDQYRTNSLKDWRVTLSLAPKAEYLYRSKNPGILAPLAATDGVIFPYTPSVQVTHAANYEPTTPTHSNYKIFQYTSSSVDQVTISGDFTAQDTFEANYLLAVIHFFRSLTKMFYGQDQNPRAGTPPPLVFLNGLGAFQYNSHPLVISNFSYNLPTDVDYIRSYLTPAAKAEEASGGSGRLGTRILPGGLVPKTVFGLSTKNENPTYVPTRIQLQISAYPIVTRNKISNEFSLEKYGSGELVSKGIW